MHDRVFSFDVGWAFHGWGVRLSNGKIDCGVYAYEHDDWLKAYSEIRREKNRKKSKRDRLDKLKEMIISTKLFSSKEKLEAYLKKASHQNMIWQNLQKAHKEKITDKEFTQILYRFAKRRHYVDMRKKSNLMKKDENSEGRAIKKSLSEMEKVYENLKDHKDKIKTWFSALFQRREDLINLFEKHGILIDQKKFPYTNAKLDKGKYISKELYKAISKEISGYDLMLTNEQIATSLDMIAKKQRELGNSSPIFSDSFMRDYRELITFKGIQPSLEDKIGLCLSGSGKKRHPKSSIDAEISSIKQSYFKILVEEDSKGDTTEFKLSHIGIDYEKYFEIVTKLASANKKGEITTKKILDVIKIEKIELKDRKILYKDFKHRTDHNKAVVLRLPGHRRTYDFSTEFKVEFMKNDRLRDDIEFKMLCYRNPDILKENLRDILDQNDIKYTKSDLEILSISDVGKPAPCNNETYRAIQEGLEVGKDFQTALIDKYPNAMVNIKRDYRKTLDYKLYLKKQKLQGINNPFQDKVVKEFIFIFNRLVQKYGEADRIVLETTRAILSEKEKDDAQKRIRENEKQNREISQILDEYHKQYNKKPAKGSRRRLKLFVQQGGELKFDGKPAKCVLTGNPISIEAAIDGDRTNSDHIIPQSWIHDSRLENEILMDKRVNQSSKEDMTPILYLLSINYTLQEAKAKLKDNIKGMKLPKIKLKHIFEERDKEKIKKDAENRIMSMDQRMKGIQDASIKVIMDLLVDQYRFNSEEKLTLPKYREKVLPVTGKMTSLFRRGWLSKYKKKREKYHNHAVDALVMLNFDRAFLTKYINLLKEAYLEDKDPIWIAKEKMFPTIEKFEENVKGFVKEYEEQSRVVVRRPVQKYKGRLYEQTAYSKGEANTIKVKKYFRKLGPGFLKLNLHKDENGKLSITKIHPGQNRKIDDVDIENTLFRDTLIYVVNKSLCGYYYVRGYSTPRLELIPVNKSSEKRLRPSIGSFKSFQVVKKLPINGKIKKPSCEKE